MPALVSYHARMSPALRRNLPNALTILRLIIAAGFFAALNAYRYPDENIGWANLAIVLFILGAFTDFLDGYLARRWHVESVFGRIMDPFCDKVLVLGAFIYLCGPRFVVPEWVEQGSFFTHATGVYPWMVMLILARELLVTSIRGVVEGMGVSFAATWSGKWKLVLQVVCVPVVLFLTVNLRTGDADKRWALYTCYVLVYATVIVTLWSGLPYVWRALTALAQAKRQEGAVS